MEAERKFMVRAMELALKGLGKVSPNPMVGCVIVHRGEVVGEGWHEYFGGPHAEVNAILSLKDKKILKRSKVYVTLEPCSHIGKTPPCTNLLIESGVKEVIIGLKDPNMLVNGTGIHQLEGNGIKVKLGYMEKQAEELNRRFVTFHLEKRPYIILKWAQTIDGYMAKENGDSKWISNEISRKLSHKWRTEEDAILVGAKTSELDNPKLTARDWEGKNPIRIVLGNPHLHSEANLFNGESKTWIFNSFRTGMGKNHSWVKFGKSTMLSEAMQYLFENNVQSLIVEGGAKTLKSFIVANLWDEARVFTSPVEFKSGIKAPELKRQGHIHAVLGDDILTVTRNYNGGRVNNK